MVNTRFWDDNYITNLDPIEKLLFLYFITNSHTNISGVYELPLKTVANDTGVDKEMVEKILKRFSKDLKVFYLNGWICVKNFIKHQNFRSPTVLFCILTELMAVPSHILEKFIRYGYGIDTPLHLTKPNLTKLKIQGATAYAALLTKNKDMNTYDENKHSDSGLPEIDSETRQPISPPKKKHISTRGFDYEASLRKLEEGTPEEKILALVWKIKGYKIANAHQYYQQHGRDMKFAKELVGHPTANVAKAIKIAKSDGEKNGYEWGVSTVAKKILVV